MNLKDYIANVPNFPIPGIQFKDITPLMLNGDAFKFACDELTKFAKEQEAELVVGPESRGFIFGCPVASNLNIGFAPIRKPGKLPREVVNVEYSLEYGTNTLCLHVDAIKKGQKVLIVDDLLATGGTVKAAIELVNKLGGIVVGCAFLIELKDLKGRELLKDQKILSLMEF